MINYVSKNKKAAIALLIVLLIGSIMLSLTSVATPVLAESNNQLTNMANVQPRMLDNILDGGNGTAANPYYVTKWNGRILVTLLVKPSSSYNYYLQISIDPRNNVFADSIIVEYRYYHITHYLAQEANEVLNNFSGHIKFYDKNANFLAEDTVDKSNDSTAGFTRSSSKTNVENVTVKVSYRDTIVPSDIKFVYFRFGTNKDVKF